MAHEEEVVVAVEVEVGEYRARGAAQFVAPSLFRCWAGREKQLVGAGAFGLPHLIRLRFPVPECPHHQVGLVVGVGVAESGDMSVHADQGLDQSIDSGDVLETCLGIAAQFRVFPAGQIADLTRLRGCRGFGAS